MIVTASLVAVRYTRDFQPFLAGDRARSSVRPFFAAFPGAAGRYGDLGTRTQSRLRAQWLLRLRWFPSFRSDQSFCPFGLSPSCASFPVSAHCCAFLYAAPATTGSMKSSRFVIIAQSWRAIRLARAMVTSIFGFFASIRASQLPSHTDLRPCTVSHAVAPIIRSLRMSASSLGGPAEAFPAAQGALPRDQTQPSRRSRGRDGTPPCPAQTPRLGAQSSGRRQA